MQLRRFVAKDMREAMRLARTRMGVQAVIISSRKVAEGVEVVVASGVEWGAAVPPAQEKNTPMPKPQEPQARLEVAVAPPSPQVLIPPPPPPPPPGHEKKAYGGMPPPEPEPMASGLEKELRSLRSLLEDQLTSFSWGGVQRCLTGQTRLLQKLARLGLPMPKIWEIVRQGAIADEEIMEAIAWRIPEKEETLIESGGVAALVGGSGVGKTTTLVKLAVHFMLRHGTKEVALITTDCYRVGAAEQVKTYGRILGIPALACADEKEFFAAFSQVAEKKLILIDTVGISTKDARAALSLLWVAKVAQVHWVVSATRQASSLFAEQMAISRLRPMSLIVTHMDETVSAGPVMSLLLQGAPPLTYLTDGPRIPEDFRLAKRMDFVREAFAMAEKGWDLSSLDSSLFLELSESGGNAC